MNSTRTVRSPRRPQLGAAPHEPGRRGVHCSPCGLGGGPRGPPVNSESELSSLASGGRATVNGFHPVKMNVTAECIRGV
eukprot:496864-Hanusia_phi.AAC.1